MCLISVIIRQLPFVTVISSMLAGRYAALSVVAVVFFVLVFCLFSVLFSLIILFESFFLSFSRFGDFLTSR